MKPSATSTNRPDPALRAAALAAAPEFPVSDPDNPPTTAADWDGAIAMTGAVTHKRCVKCDHEAPTSTDPAAACPACGAIYAKVEGMSESQLAVLRSRVTAARVRADKEMVQSSAPPAVRSGFYLGIWILTGLLFAATLVLKWMTPPSQESGAAAVAATEITVYDSSPPALKLAAIAAGSTTVSVTQANQYRDAMSALNRVCLESEQELADTFVVGARLMEQNGHKADMLQLMRGVASTVPEEAGKLRCDEIAAAVIALSGRR